MRNIRHSQNETFGHQRENTTYIFIRIVSLFTFFPQSVGVFIFFYLFASSILETMMIEKKKRDSDACMSCECSMSRAFRLQNVNSQNINSSEFVCLKSVEALT